MTDSPGLTRFRDALRAVEPRARLVPARALRRVIRLSREQREFQSTAVHDRAWWIEREQLFLSLSPEELGIDPNDPSPKLLLLPIPESEPAPADWQKLWRDLFHVAVDGEIDSALLAGKVDVAAVCAKLGPARWDSIRQVLTEENLIAELDDNARALREFAAFALELLHFQPADWDCCFPGLSVAGEPLRSVLTLVDRERLFTSTRPPGCPVLPGAQSQARIAPAATEALATASAPEEAAAETDFANDVGAAVALYRVDDPAAERHLDQLAQRLRRLLDLAPEEMQEWRRELASLLPPAAAGGWPPERRLLYDLQRACLAVERPTYAADLVEWAVTFGRRPIKRALPRTKWVVALRRLRSACHYVTRVPAAPTNLTHLCEHALHVAEGEARDDLRPEIERVLQEVGLVPNSTAEELSLRKLVEELLDAACLRGFLRIGDLRDAIARNRIKLPDLSGPREFFVGDALLQANARLPECLDGVYHRGEVYMRLLQRTCSVFFGTRVGRWLTRYVAIPFGGSFVLLEGIRHLIEAGQDLVHWITGQMAAEHGVSVLGGGMAATLADNPTLERRGITWPAFLSVAVFFLLVIHWPAFRRRVLVAARFVFTKLPALIRRSELIHALVNNRFTRFLRRFVLIPLAIGGVAGLGMYLLARNVLSAGLVGGGAALFSGAFFRTPLGRRIEDRMDEAAERVWRVLTVNFVVGLITLILHFFQMIFEVIDRTIYAVDEWLRFREGENRFSFVFKLLFGVLWFSLTYVFRFAWTLMVEPQVNPIKHFPVVTVSHKLLLPLIPSLAKQFQLPEKTMGTIVFGIPGIFGFLVWELRENWKLYRSNAAPELQPAIVGAHGEKVRSLLRPGLHSGVVPKTLAKLRKAVRGGKSGRVTKLHHALEHIAEAVHRFCTREFVACLRVSQRWNGIAVAADTPILTPNQLLLPVAIGPGSEHAVIVLEERGGWVIGSVRGGPGLDRLDAPARAAFTDALAGLYKRAGVNLVREQAADIFGPQAFAFDAVPEGLLIPKPDGTTEFFEYEDGPELKSPQRGVAAKTMMLSVCPLLWTDWVKRWEEDAAGKNPPGLLLPGWKLLPARGCGE